MLGDFTFDWSLVRSSLLRIKAYIKEADGQYLAFSDYDKRTALHVAASEGHTDLVVLLMNAGANPNRSDRWGGSPLDDAQRHGHPEVAKVLRERGGRLGSRDHGAALIEAACQNDLEAASFLILDGTDVDSADYDQRTALHLASSEGHLSMVSTLIAANADVSCRDRWGGQPLDDALRRGHSACVALLREHGAELGADGSSGHTGSSHRSIEVEQLTDRSLLVDWEDITVLEKIGSGAFGDIMKCSWRGTLVAAKTIKSGESLHGGGIFGGGSLGGGGDGGGGGGDGGVHGSSPMQRRADAIADFKLEIGFLGRLRHPNICMLLGYSLKAHTEVMLSELMKCSLLDVLKTFAARGTPFSLQRTISYAIQFAQGMNFLHTHKPPILHRDLKPANLLLDFTDTLKVSDFGLAKLRPIAADPSPNPSHADDEYQPYVMTGETGSYRYMAPEVFRHEAYGRPVDVYSFAMIVHYMLSGEPPWPHLDGLRAVQGASKSDRPIVERHWDVKLCQLLIAAWHDAPGQRPSFSAVLEQLNAFHLTAFRCTWEEANRKGLTAGASTASAGCCVVM